MNKKLLLTGVGIFAAYTLLKGESEDNTTGSYPNIIDIIEDLPTHPEKTYQSRSLSQIDRILIHHSATTSGNPYAYADYHINERDFPGIAYTFTIAKNGTIHQTNYLDTISYHATGQNTRSISICLTGNYDIQTVPAAQYDALIQLIRYLSIDFGELPLYEHNDFATKSCPGANVSAAAIEQDAYNYNEIGRLHNYRFVPVYKQLPTNTKNGRTNIDFARGKSGVYLIKENGKIVYVGYSGSDVYKTALRHFQNWNDSDYEDRITYRHRLNRNRYTIRIVLTSANRAIKLETALIGKYKPRDNGAKLNAALSPQEEKTLEMYLEAPAEKIPDWDVEVPF